MSNAADFIQVVQTIPQWGLWFTVSLVLGFVLVKLLYAPFSKAVRDFRHLQKETNDIAQLLKEGSHVWDSDPPRYVGHVELLNEIRENRTKWSTLSTELIDKCASSKCPWHTAMNQEWKEFANRAINELKEFSAKADISRAETKGLVEGITKDVTLLRDHTMPLIATVVEKLGSVRAEKERDRS